MQTTCPIWQTPAEIAQGRGAYVIVRSERAGGDYKITRSAQVDRSSAGDLIENAPKITTWLEEQRRAGDVAPMLTSQILQAIFARPSLSVGERVNRTLRYIASQTPSIGSQVRYAGMDADFKRWQTGTFIATESRDTQEISTLIGYLVERQLLKTFDGQSYHITIDGWEYLDRLNAEQSASEQAFVAMWFDVSMADAYSQGIAPAVEGCGYRPLWIDNKEHINKIDDEIISEIRR